MADAAAHAALTAWLAAHGSSQKRKLRTLRWAQSHLLITKSCGLLFMFAACIALIAGYEPIHTPPAAA